MGFQGSHEVGWAPQKITASWLQNVPRAHGQKRSSDNEWATREFIYWFLQNPLFLFSESLKTSDVVGNGGP